MHPAGEKDIRHEAPSVGRHFINNFTTNALEEAIVSYKYYTGPIAQKLSSKSGRYLK